VKGWLYTRRIRLLESIAPKVLIFARALQDEGPPSGRTADQLNDFGMVAAAQLNVDMPDEAFRCWVNQRMEDLILPAVQGVMIRVAAKSSNVVELGSRPIADAWLNRHRLRIFQSIIWPMAVTANELMTQLKPKRVTVEDLQFVGAQAIAVALAKLPHEIVWHCDHDDVADFLKRIGWQAIADAIDDAMSPSAA
jgi:hypothetical protein